MPYIGRSTDGFGVRNRFLYLASASDTSVSGADVNGATLSFSDGAYVDVYLNGVLLKAGTDYNTNTANTIAGISSMSANDEVTVIVYDIFAVADTVSQSSGGTFSGAITFDSTVSGLDVNGTEIILDADGDTTITADTDDQIDIKIAGADDFQFTANTFTAQSGSTIAAQALTATTITTSSTIDVQGNEIILDDDGDTSITADTDDQIDFKVAGDDHVKIKGGTNVLHVIEGSSGQGTPHTNSSLVLESDGETGINILSGNTNFAGIVFGDDGDNDIGFIQYKHDDNYLRFGTNTYERKRINGNGMIEIMTQNTGSAGAAINFGYRTTDFYATTTSSPTEQKKGGFAHFRKGGPDLDQTTNHFCNPTSDGWSMFYLAKLHDGGTDQRYFDFYWNTSSASSIGTIKGNGSNISYNTSSDYRLKENVVNSDLDKLYSQVKSLNVKTYNFKSTPDITQHGFLAHEAKDVWDYVCDTPKDAMKDDVEGGTKDADGNPAKVPDYQQLDYGKFTPMIMGALQKAMEKIETLETKVETLEAKVKALEEA